MARLIVRRRREPTAGSAYTPIRLPLKIYTVAGGAVLLVNRSTHGDLFWIIGICAGNRRHWPIHIDDGSEADGSHTSNKHRNKKHSPLGRGAVA